MDLRQLIAIAIVIDFELKAEIFFRGEKSLGHGPTNPVAFLLVYILGCVHQSDQVLELPRAIVLLRAFLDLISLPVATSILSLLLAHHRLVRFQRNEFRTDDYIYLIRMRCCDSRGI